MARRTLTRLAVAFGAVALLIVLAVVSNTWLLWGDPMDRCQGTSPPPDSNQSQVELDAKSDVLHGRLICYWVNPDDRTDFSSKAIPFYRRY